MKRFLAIASFLASVLALSACDDGGGGQDEGQTGQSQQQQQSY